MSYFDQPYTLILALYYSIVCFLSGVQLSQIYLNQHSLWSFHSGFLVLCFLWTILRSFFFWMLGRSFLTIWLYWMPNMLLFATFSLLVVFFYYMLHQYEWNNKRCCVTAMYCVINGVFLLITCICGFFACDEDGCHPNPEVNNVYHVYMAVQFSLLTILYAYFAYKISQLQELPFFTENSFSVVFITALVWLLFASRSVYNYLVVFDKDKFSLYVHFADGKPMSMSFTAFILFVVWELIPTTLILFHFRVPNTCGDILSLLCCWATKPKNLQSNDDALLGTPNPEFYYDFEDTGSRLGSSLPSPSQDIHASAHEDYGISLHRESNLNYLPNSDD